MVKKIAIEGMSCGHCVARVEKALKGVNGVSGVEVSLAGKSASVTGDGLAEEALRAAVEGAGYEVTGIA
jgi:copper chaperone CopZ